MYKITINDQDIISVDPGKDNSFIVDGQIFTPDILEIKSGLFNILHKNKSFNAELIRHDSEEKTFYFKINNNHYKVQVRDRYDELLKELGMDSLQAKKAADLKAPMPGLVVEVCVNEGQEIKKGDKLIVLEAMKMENILKAQADGIVKKINAKKGNTVEKNEVLILLV